MNKRTNFTYKKKLIVFSIILFIIKLIILPFIHEIDADGVSRVYLSLQFANNPFIINTGNWPLIFFYIMGVALKVYDNQFVTPVLVNILFSVFLLFPLFNLLKRYFGDKISFLLCVFFSFSPVVFRMSMLAMSEIPYLFFVILSVSILLKGLSKSKASLIFLAGLLMSIAGGIRYESWILGGFVVIVLAYFKTKKEAVFFALTFVLIPTYWILSSFIYTNEALNSFNWAINISDKESINSIDSLLRRIWWYPLSLMFAFGPIAFFYFIKELKNYKSNKISFTLFLIFITFFGVWIINSLRGSLLLQHRFSITLFLLSFPLIGFYFKRNQNKIVLKTLIFSLSAFLFAFLYNSKGARPIPRLLTKDAQEVSSIINNNINSNSGFICDFWNWETTYYLPFATGLTRNKIKLIDSDGQIDHIKEQVTTITNKNNNGVILINKNNSFYKIFIKQVNKHLYDSKKENLVLEKIFENDLIICFKYKKIANNT